MKCLNCGKKIRSDGRYCGACNSERCKSYYRKNREAQIARKTAYYFERKKIDHESVRATNRKAVSVKRFGVVSRDEILKRDNYQCQQCGSTKSLVIHHSDGVGRNTTSPNNSLRNLVTVCASCHANHHFGHSKMKI